MLEPGGLPLAFLEELVDGDADPPDGWLTGRLGSLGAEPRAMAPSGPYFLGLPLFFLSGSVLILKLIPNASPPCAVASAPLMTEALRGFEEWKDGGEVARGLNSGVRPSVLKDKCMFCKTGSDGAKLNPDISFLLLQFHQMK